MLHRNTAHTRPSFEQSAPQMFQQLPRAQNAANGGMTSQPTRHLAGAPTTAAGAAGISSTSCTSLILDVSALPSPPSPTTQHTEPAWRQAAPITNGKAQSECGAQQALHHHNKIDNKQAGSSSLQLGGGSSPAAATPAAGWDTLQPTSAISRPEPGTPRLHRPAPDLSLGAGYEQTEPGLNPLPATSKKINSVDRKKLQSSTQVPEARKLFYHHGTNALAQLHRLARNAPHPPGQGSAQGSNGLQLGDSSTPAAASARFSPQLASTTTWAHRFPHMPRHARDPPFVTGHEQAQLGMDPLAAETQKIYSDVRSKLQAGT